VQDIHTYYVSAAKVLVHNCGGKTPHSIGSGGNAPTTSTPNSIHETRRPDGSKSITYYDEKGRAFSREDYGQLRGHKDTIPLGDDGKALPHEHRYNYTDYGIDKSQNAVRLLDSNGMPTGSWMKD
jgi:hypothetical protein